MLIVDVLIVFLVVYGVIYNYHRGFLAVAINICVLIASLLTAAVLYRPLSGWVLAFYKTYPAVMNVISYLLVLVVTQFVLLWVAKHAIRKVPQRVVFSKLNMVGGSLLGGLQMLVFAAIALLLFMNLPVNVSQKDKVSSSFLAKPLLGIGSGLESLLATIPGSDFTQTLNLLTIKPHSDESIDLGFTTTDVKPDPAAESRMLEMVNLERTNRGLKPLKTNEKARAVARRHSVDMFARGYFAHVNPDGLDPFDRMERGSVQFLAAGENLALAPTLQQAHVGLMNSPGHRANILSPDFGAVGIGVIDGGPYGLMITQNFTN